MASLMDEEENNQTEKLAEEKRRKKNEIEQIRTRRLKEWYDRLKALLPESIVQSILLLHKGRRKGPNRLEVLSGALTYIKSMKEQLAAKADESTGLRTPQISADPSERCPTSTVPAGASNVLPTHDLEQDPGNHGYQLSPWLPANNYCESILPSISGVPCGSSIYCRCCEDYWWQSGYYHCNYP